MKIFTTILLILVKLKCFLGLHDWQDEIEGNRYGHRSGDRCKRKGCRVWSNNSTVTEYYDHDDEMELP